MQLSLTDIKRLATDVARDEDPDLQVVAALNAEGAAAFAEVMLTRNGDPREQRLVIGLIKGTSESDARRALRDRLREHLRTAAR